MTKIISYRNWDFEVDFERTKHVYALVESGSPENCSCGDCKNFALNRENIYPQEFKNLLSDLGIDYKKESEIFSISLDKNTSQYGGWFHFKGKILKGKDANIPLGNNANNVEFFKISEEFEIAFMKDQALTFFDKSELNNLIQVEFMAKTNWGTWEFAT